MHFLHIPIEIINEILLNTSRNDLLQCALSCKSLSTASLQVFYKNVNLTAQNICILNSQMNLEKHERDCYFRYGAFVLSLEISDDLDDNEYTPNSESVMDKDSFIAFLEYLPNLEVLNIKRSAFVVEYFRWLLYTQSTGCLNRIQHIDYDENSIQRFHTSLIFDLHFLVCYKYRATINRLVLHYKHQMIEVDSHHDRTLTFLSHFKNVQHLLLVNQCDDALEILDITKICPNLISLQYKSDRTMSDTRLSNDSTNSKMTRCLKSLTLEVPTVSTGLIEYITDYVPAQIDSINITMYDTDLCDWINTVGINNALKCVAHLGTFKVIRFNFEPPKTYRRRSKQEESKTTLLFKLLGAFKANKKSAVHAYYDDFSSVRDSLAYNSDYGITVNIGSKIGNGGSYDESRIKLEFPDTQRSVIGLEAINHMHAIMYDKRPEVQTYFLKEALSRCPDLLSFNFRFSLNLYRGVRLKTINYPSSPKNKLNVMKIGDYLPTGEFMDLLTTHLPNIEILSVGSPGKSRQALTSPIMIDLRPFGNLQKFSFNLQILLGRRSEHGVNITLCYNDSSSRYYSQVKETRKFVEKNRENKEASSEWIYDNLTIGCNKDLEVYIYSDDDTLIAEFGKQGYTDRTSDSNRSEVNPFFM